MKEFHFRLPRIFVALVLAFSAMPAIALTVADLSGTWNVVNFSMPNRFTLQRNVRGAVTGIDEADQFQSSTGTLTVQSDGTFSGNVPDPITGTVALGGRGQVIMNVNTEDGAQTMTFHVNSTGDFLTTGGSFGGNSQEVIMVLRAPTSATPSEVQGAWNVSSFQTPRRLDLVRNGSNEVINVNGLDGFRTLAGNLNINDDGTASGQVGSPFTATYTIGNNGHVDVVVTTDEGTMPFTLFLNAGKDTMVALSGADSPNDNYQELLVFQRASASTATNELSGLWRVVTYDAPRPSQVKNAEGVLIGLNSDSNFRTSLQRVIVGHDGFFVAYVGDVVTGTLTPRNGGFANVTAQNSEGTENLLFCVSAGKTIMGSAFGDSSSQELLLLTRAAPGTGPTDDFGLITSRSGNGIHLQWAATTNSVLQASSDLLNWETVTNTLAQHEYVDSGTNSAMRYYRIQQPAP
jgi:hypothetical protein